MPRLLQSSLASLAILATTWLAAAEPLVFDVAEAAPGHDQRSGEPIVLIRFTAESARRYALFTLENVGRRIEIRLDGKVLTAPVIREPILQGSGQISGHLSEQDARNLAARLTAGAKLEIEAVAN